MPIGTICLALLVEDDPAPSAAAQYALALAQRTGARLIARIGAPTLPSPAFGYALNAAASQLLAIADRILLERRHRADECALSIETQARALGVETAVETFSGSHEALSPRMAALARVSDVCVAAAASRRDAPTREFLIDLMLAAGGPLLIAPANWSRPGVITRAVIGWDGGVAAARAARDALPLLGEASAEAVSVLGEREIAPEPTGEQLVSRLARGCREATFQTLPVRDGGVSVTLYQHARIRRRPARDRRLRPLAAARIRAWRRYPRCLGEHRDSNAAFALTAPMPYRSAFDLPPAVRDRLPAHAQEIFLAAFNHAFEQYSDRLDREAAAFRVAWAAVKRKYGKQGEAWVERSGCPGAK